MEEGDRQDVIEFLAANGIDDRASEGLLSAPAHIQDAVMSRGDLTDARNPSSAVLGRIRDAKKLLGSEPPAEEIGGAIMDEGLLNEIEIFVAENGVDERAAKILLSSLPDVVKHVLNRGSLENARNPSSALQGRIRDAQIELGVGKQSSGAKPRASALSADPDTLEAFITENNLDERAAEAMRKATPDVQQAVILRGSLAETRNPSSAVLGRLRDAKAGNYEVAAGPRGFLARPSAANASNDEIEEFLMAQGVDERAQEAFRNASPEVQTAVIARGDLSGTRNPSSALCGRIRDAQAAPTGSGGSYGRASAGKGGSKGGPYKGGAAKGGSLESFIRQNDIDERAAEALRSAGPEVQQIVIERGDLKATRNPSSAVQGRIRDAQATLAQGGGCGFDDYGSCFGKGDYGMMGGMGDYGSCFGKGGYGMSPALVGPGELQRFVNHNGLDERAVGALESCAPEVLRAVIDRGSLKETRNPSSAVVGRIKDAQAKCGGMGFGGNGCGSWMPVGPPAMMWNPVTAFIQENNVDQRGADALMNASWEVQEIVISRGGLERTRNPSSALLGRIRDAESGVGGAGARRGGGGAFGPMDMGGDPVSDFIMENNLDSRAQEALLSASPAVQKAVIARGGLQETRNPSSAVIGRIRDAESGGGKGKGRAKPY